MSAICEQGLERDYQRVGTEIGQFLLCPDCGSFVWDADKHDDWHRAIQVEP